VAAVAAVVVVVVVAAAAVPEPLVVVVAAARAVGCLHRQQSRAQPRHKEPKQPSSAMSMS